MGAGFSWADLANLGANVAIVLLFLRYLAQRDALFQESQNAVAAALRELSSKLGKS